MPEARINIPHDAIVLVADGQKALFLRNKGDEKFLHLSTERVFVDDNPLSHEQGTDRPGRAFARASTHRRSAVENADWHEREKHRFVRQTANILESLIRQTDPRSIVVVAPARVIADLRQPLTKVASGRIIAEIVKDLTNHPIPEIENYLAEHS